MGLFGGEGGVQVGYVALPHVNDRDSANKH